MQNHNSARKRIVVTVNATWNLTNYRLGLIKSLLATNAEVIVLSALDQHANDLTAIGCKVIPLEMDRKGLSPRRDFGLLMQLHRQLRSIQPDLVLSFTVKNNVYAGMVCQRLRIPFIPNISGLGTAFTSSALLRFIAIWMYRVALRQATRVFFQNPDDADLFLKQRIVQQDQFEVLPGSGIDLDHFQSSPLPADKSEITFVLICRMLWNKGVGEFVEAARAIKATHSNCRFQLIGYLDVDNPMAISREQMSKWVSSGSVEYLEPVDDIRPVIQRATCVVLPSSYGEGTPRTLIEALALGRPIITTDMPGCREVLDPGVNGYFCEANNSQSLAKAMVTLANLSESERAQLGKNGREIAEQRYDHQIVITAYKRQIDLIVK